MSSASELNITGLKKIAKELKIRGYTKYKKENKDELGKLIEEKTTPSELTSMILKIKSGKIQKVKDKKETDESADTGDWVKLRQLGSKGKDGTIYLVINEKGEPKAMKVFRKNKNSGELKREIDFQIKASESSYELSPKIIEYSLSGKYIVMEKLDKTLVDILKEQGGLLKLEQQKEIIKLYGKLDKLNIFHNDANPLNIMTKGERWYMIDYGFSCTCQHKDIIGVKHPNVQFMCVGLLTWLVEKGYDIKNYTYLLKFLSNRVKNKLLK